MSDSADGIYINIPTPTTNMINWLISTAWTLLFFYGISYRLNATRVRSILDTF